MLDWDFAQWSKFLLTALAIFALIGGITSQTSAGVSGRGFLEGMWKGTEWFLIGVAIAIAGVGVLWGMGMISNALNSAG